MKSPKPRPRKTFLVSPYRATVAHLRELERLSALFTLARGTLELIQERLDMIREEIRTGRPKP